MDVNIIPSEIWAEILSYCLDPKDHCSLYSLTRGFRQLGLSNEEYRLFVEPLQQFKPYHKKRKYVLLEWVRNCSKRGLCYYKEKDHDSSEQKYVLRVIVCEDRFESIQFFLVECYSYPPHRSRILDYGMIAATFMGRKDLINLFIEEGANDWNHGLFAAIVKEHKDLIDFFIEKEAGDWDLSLFYAAITGKMDLVDFFTEKGTTYWNGGLYGAALGGHFALVKYFFRKGAKSIDVAMQYAAKGGHKTLVKFFIEKGAREWNWGIEGAAEGGHKELVEFFIQKGTNDWNSGMRGAARGGHKDLVQFFITKGVICQESLIADMEDPNPLNAIERRLYPKTYD